MIALRATVRLLLCIGAFLTFIFPAVATAQEPPPPFDPDAVEFPQVLPNARRGQQSFQENCAPCHGVLGNSDGPAAAELPAPPPQLADPQQAVNRSPAEYFHIVKYGNIEKLMPPWLTILSDPEIWDVAFFAWSLHTNEADVSSGRTLYDESCASCHGPAGMGDGPEAPPDLAGLRDALFLYRQGEVEEGWRNAHPEIGAEWDEAQRVAVIESMRTLVYRPPWAPLYAPGIGEISGRLQQGSPGGGSVADQVVSLRAFVEFSQVAAFTATVDIDGSFVFPQLDTESGVIYFVETRYDEVLYDSDLVELSSAAPQQNVDLVIYERNSDDSGVRIERANWVMDFQPGLLVIGQILAFSNESDFTYEGKEVAGIEQPVTVQLHLPAAAADLRLQDGEVGGRYFQQDGMLYDTTPIRPGETTRQIFLSYSLPAEGAEMVLNQQFDYPLRNLNLLVADLPELEASVEGMEYVGQDTLQGAAYRLWNQVDLAPATAIEVQLSGLLMSGAVDPRASGESATDASGAVASPRTAPPLDPRMAIGFGTVIALLLLAVPLLLWRRGGAKPKTLSSEALSNELTMRIARLDDAHDTGQLSHSEWVEQRTQLKAQLIAMADQSAE